MQLRNLYMDAYKRDVNLKRYLPWGFLYKPSKRGILEINETGLGLAVEQSHRDRSSQKTSETHSDHTN
jgi:hypothetical protein